MDPIFWFPIGAVVIGCLLGAYLGGRSISSTPRTGMEVGIFIGFMATFPLLAIGLANL